MRRRYTYTISIINAGRPCARRAINDCLGRNAGFPIPRAIQTLSSRPLCAPFPSPPPSAPRDWLGGAREGGRKRRERRHSKISAVKRKNHPFRVLLPARARGQRSLINRAAFCIVEQLFPSREIHSALQRLFTERRACNFLSRS